MSIYLSASNRNNRLISLAWTSSTPVQDYEIYRRKTSDTNGNPIETNFSIVSGYNAINDGKSYRDIDVWDSFNPTKPTIKKSLQTEASKITIDIYSEDIGIVYEYYIKGISDGETTTSAVQKVTITAGIKKYKYIYKEIISGVLPVIQPADFIYTTTDPKITLTGLDTGEYVFQIIAIDDNNNESEVTETKFKIINSIFEEANTNYGIPNAVRYNHRYRGPQEHRKIDMFYSYVKSNLIELKRKVEYLEEHKKKVLEKPAVDNTAIILKIESTDDSLQKIREEILYEQRNN